MTKRLPTTFRETIVSMLQAYKFETPDGHPIPNDLQMLEREAKIHGYMIGKVKFVAEDSLSSKIVYVGPPRRIRVDENGRVFIIAM